VRVYATTIANASSRSTIPPPPPHTHLTLPTPPQPVNPPKLSNRRERSNRLTAPSTRVTVDGNDFSVWTRVLPAPLRFDQLVLVKVPEKGEATGQADKR
jgi:hypothetical protein